MSDITVLNWNRFKIEKPGKNDKVLFRIVENDSLYFIYGQALTLNDELYYIMFANICDKLYIIEDEDNVSWSRIN